MSTLPDSAVYRHASEALAGQSPELAWLAPLRERSLQRFLAAGFPQTDHEDWRYTDLREAAALSAELLDAVVVEDQVPADTADDATIRLTLVDGIFRAELSSSVSVRGLCVHALRRAPAARQAQLLERLNGAAEEPPAPLTDFNAALLRDGLVVEVDAGIRLEQPLHIVSWSRPGRVSQTRIIVTLGAGSHAMLIEHHRSGAPTFANVVTDVRCGAGASLDYARIQDEHDGSIHLASQSFALAEASEARLTHVDLGGKLARSDLRVRLPGVGAAVHARGLFIADGSRHLDNHTRIDHLAARTTSRELYRGILDGSGHGVFNGKIIVHPGAAGADARLTNQNLLLARTAEIDTKPELEIYTDDVRCSHGATTGQLDPAALFYLRSRGLGPTEARRLLIAAFAREILAGVTAGAVAARLGSLLAGRLPDLAGAMPA